MLTEDNRLVSATLIHTKMFTQWNDHAIFNIIKWKWLIDWWIFLRHSVYVHLVLTEMEWFKFLKDILIHINIYTEAKHIIISTQSSPHLRVTVNSDVWSKTINTHTRTSSETLWLQQLRHPFHYQSSEIF